METAPTPPLDLAGVQAGSSGRGGRPPQPAPAAFTPQARAIEPRESSGGRGALLPPADIPNAGRVPRARDKGLLDKLFGTL